MKPKILFVDDEARVLDGLKRMLRPLRNEWEMKFVLSGQEALEIFDAYDVDVVVSDMRMPGMDGAQLLAIVKEKHPETVRFVLSGHAEEKDNLRAIAVTHQFLSKPCSGEVLVEHIRRSLTLRECLRTPEIVSLIVGTGTIPSPPSMYQKLLKIIDTPTASLQDVTTLVSRDPSFAAKILQISSSAFLGSPSKAASITQAVRMMGLNTLRMLALQAGVLAMLPDGNFDDELFLERSRTAGTAARKACNAIGISGLSLESSVAASMLHQIGSIILAARHPKKWALARSRSPEGTFPSGEAEIETFGVNSPKVGASLLGLWGISDDIVNAVAYHRKPDEASVSNHTSTVLALTHFATIIADRICGTGGSPETQPDDALLNMDSLQLAPLLDKVTFRTREALDLQ